MMNKINCRYFIVFLVILLVGPLGVWGEVCDSEHLKQLKVLADKVYIAQEYVDNKSDVYLDEFGNYKKPEVEVDDRYYINVNLFSDELYLVVAGSKYYYEPWNPKGIILMANSGNVEMEVRSSRCYNKKLRTIRLNLPKFNTYSYRDECRKENNSKLEICDPWYQGEITEEEFLNLTKDGLIDAGSDMFSILEFLKNNIWVVAAVAVVLFFISVVIFVKVKKKKYVLE